MKSSCVAVLLGLLIITMPLAASAEEGGSMNPFNFKKRQRKPPTSASARKAPGSGWKWPSLWPGKESQPVAQQRQPANQTAWQKMNEGTKNFFSQTAADRGSEIEGMYSPPRSVQPDSHILWPSPLASTTFSACGPLLAIERA